MSLSSSVWNQLGRYSPSTVQLPRIQVTNQNLSKLMPSFFFVPDSKIHVGSWSALPSIHSLPVSSKSWLKLMSAWWLLCVCLFLDLMESCAHTPSAKPCQKVKLACHKCTKFRFPRFVNTLSFTLSSFVGFYWFYLLPFCLPTGVRVNDPWSPWYLDAEGSVNIRRHRQTKCWSLEEMLGGPVSVKQERRHFRCHR